MCVSDSGIEERVQSKQLLSVVVQASIVNITVQRKGHGSQVDALAAIADCRPAQCRCHRDGSEYVDGCQHEQTGLQLAGCHDSRQRWLLRTGAR